MPRRNNGPKLVWLAKRGSFYVTWTANGRSRQRSAGTAEREEAEVVLAEVLGERRRRAGPREPGDCLVTDVLADYAEDKVSAVIAGDRIAFAIPPLVDYWAGKSVGDVTRLACEAYRRQRGRSDGTVRRELGVLRAAINHAFAENRISRTAFVHLPPRPEAKDRWLTKREAATLLRSALAAPHARLYLPLFLVIGLHTGARKEAILSLRWSQVDLESGLIDWNPAGRARTKKQRPRVRIPPRLLGHLRRARVRGSDLGFVVHKDGHPLKDIKKSLKSACIRAGMVDVSAHTLRHTRATWGMQAGADKWGLCGFLGMTLQTLEQVYGHHHPDYQRQASEAY